MKEHKKQPIASQEINLSYTKGIYIWFCKNIAALAAVAVAILSSAGRVLKAAEYTALVKALWIVNHMKRKLEGICSISSSVLDNCFCQRWRNIAGCICEHCYSAAQQSYQNGLREHSILNGIILRNILIPVKYFRILKIVFPYLRIESFGDVANVTQARNYIRIIKAFPEKRCAIWSKNLAIWAEAFRAEGKPRNTTFVASSPYLNKPIAETILDNFPFIDHIFTVYDKKYAKKHNIVINCGGRKCLDCILKGINCYFRNNNLYINELKK